MWEVEIRFLLCMYILCPSFLSWKRGGSAAGSGFCGLADLGRRVAGGARPGLLKGRA